MSKSINKSNQVAVMVRESKLKTLEDLENEEAVIYYEDGSDLDDLFIEMEIVNPENQQKSIYAWVPESMERALQAEYDTTITTQYHDWTSKLVRATDGHYYDTEEESTQRAEEIKKEFMSDNPTIIEMDYEIMEAGDGTYYIAFYRTIIEYYPF